MAFGLIVVGDEILSGKRSDKHFERFRALLAERELELSWVRYVGDERALIERTLRETFALDDVVFCCGGIGATPDDHTRQAAAALGRALVLHPEAEALIAERCRQMAAEGRGSADMSQPENRQRLRMGEFPEGAAIIPNPFNRIPGFRVGSHWFLPGFPVMAWPMAENALDTFYRDPALRSIRIERGFVVFDTPESAVTPMLEDIENRFAGVSVFCLPSSGADGQRRYLEVGVKGKGPAQRIDAACRALRASIESLGSEIRDSV